MARRAHAAQTLRQQFDRAFPHRSRASDGWIADGNHPPSSYHHPRNGVVYAHDFTHDPARGMDIDRLTDELVASGDNRIYELIANGLYWKHSDRRWVNYTGANRHDKHFHITVKPGVLGEDPRPWNLPSFAAPPAKPSWKDEFMSQGTMPACDVGHNGTIIPKRAYFCATTGRASGLTNRTWFSLATGWDSGDCHVWFVGTKTGADGQPAPQYLRDFSASLPRNGRQVWQAPDGTDQIAVEYRSKNPVGW
ncbi:MAG: hypothetical protein ACRDRM_08715, partial [Pseudonocardiaceae bacterium]